MRTNLDTISGSLLLPRVLGRLLGSLGLETVMITWTGHFFWPGDGGWFLWSWSLTGTSSIVVVEASEVVVISSFFVEVVVVVVVVDAVVSSAVSEPGVKVGSFVASSFFNLTCGESFFWSISTRSEFETWEKGSSENHKYHLGGSFGGLRSRSCQQRALSKLASAPFFDVLSAFHG